MRNGTFNVYHTCEDLLLRLRETTQGAWQVLNELNPSDPGEGKELSDVMGFLCDLDLQLTEMIYNIDTREDSKRQKQNK